MSPAAWVSPRLLYLPRSPLPCPAASFGLSSTRAGIRGSACFLPACVVNKPPGTSFRRHVSAPSCGGGAGGGAGRKESGAQASGAQVLLPPSSQRWILVRYCSRQLEQGDDPSPKPSRAWGPELWERRRGSQRLAGGGLERAGASFSPRRRWRGSRPPPRAGGHAAAVWECLTLSQFPAA